MAKLIPTLPLETRCPTVPLRQFSGFWLPEMILSAWAVHCTQPSRGPTTSSSRASPSPHDVAQRRRRRPPRSTGRSTRRRTPATRSAFETPMTASASSSCPPRSPRAPAEHRRTCSRRSLRHGCSPPTCPTDLSPGARRGDNLQLLRRVVYVCRDPKDALVSGWLFMKKHTAATAKGAGGEDDDVPPTYPLQDAFELFCAGRCVGGPQWLHVLGYWEESRRRPDKVLFLQYEEMLRDPWTNVKRLAEFMGCPFTVEEETAGTVDAVVELCSLDSLKRSKGNRSGTTILGIENASFFRKGAAGDWRNHLTPEMAARLDEIVDGVLQGSGLTFGGAANDSVSV
ncbi:unnamed protein product [Miscanthus lutarioriparius]|uniref:Sulfotransferase n=1 Tax=Miscanthus lutarioriparius TaxID=422564 RepID=A0A811QLE0_9POAL|nr:unnamed protein product [Miscanthus lutarioriparius]